MRAAFVPGTDTIASAGEDKLIRRWVSPPAAVLQAPVTAAGYSPDGSEVLSGGLTGPLRVWNPATGAVTLLRGHRKQSQAEYSPDGAQIASASLDGTVRLWQRGSTDSKVVFSDDSEIFVATFDRAGRRLAIARGRPTIVLVELDDRRARPASRPHRRGGRRRLQPGRQAARQRLQRRHGAAVGCGERRAAADALRARAVRELGRLQPRRAAPRQRGRRRDGSRLERLRRPAGDPPGPRRIGFGGVVRPVRHPRRQRRPGRDGTDLGQPRRRGARRALPAPGGGALGGVQPRWPQRRQRGRRHRPHLALRGLRVARTRS